MSNRITIDKDYSIDFDGRCATLIHHTVISGTGRGSHLIKAENIGKTRDTELGHFGRIDQALSAYLNHAVASSASNVPEIITKLSEISKTISQFNIPAAKITTA